MTITEVKRAVFLAAFTAEWRRIAEKDPWVAFCAWANVVGIDRAADELRRVAGRSAP